MYNNVVTALAEELSSTPMAILIFNFRGVGGSEGNYGGAIGEREDVTAAIDWILSRPEVDERKIALVGYSFSAMVATPVACRDSRIKAVALVAPPLDTEHIELLKQCTIPRLIVAGSEDDVALFEEVSMWASELPAPSQFHPVQGADHFWQGQENEAAVPVKTFMLRYLR
jgi:alpha/beta superfamily hydrolase